MPRPRTASIDQRGDAHRVRITVGGVRHTFTVPTKSRRAAELFAARKLTELERDHERAALGLPRSQAFSELLATIEREEFATLAPGTRASYGYALKPIRAHFVEKLGDPTSRRSRPSASVRT